MTNQTPAPPDSDTRSAYQPQWDKPIRLLALVFLIVVGVFTIGLLAPVLPMLMIAFIIVALLIHPVQFITERTVISYAGAVIIVYLGVVVIGLVVLLTIVPRIADGLRDLGIDLNEAIAQLEAYLIDYVPGQAILEITPAIRIDLDSILSPLRDLIVSEPLTGGTPQTFTETDLRQFLEGILNLVGGLTTTVAAAVTNVVGLVSTLLLALFVSLLVIIDLPNSASRLAQSIPPSYQREYALLLQKMNTIWSEFFKGQGTLALIVGILTFAQLTIMGVPNALLLAVFTALISLIPTLGGFIALVPLTIVPLLEGSTTFPEMSRITLTLLVVVGNLLISQLIWNVIAPRIMGSAMNLPMPVIIVGVFVGAALGGILGAFLIAPIIGILRILVFYMLAKINGNNPFPGEEPHVPLEKGYFRKMVQG